MKRIALVLLSLAAIVIALPYIIGAALYVAVAFGF